MLATLPESPVLQFRLGWIKWLTNDFKGATTEFAKAARSGEPNSAYLLAYTALGLLDGGDSVVPDASMLNNSFDAKLARDCLELSVGSRAYAGRAFTGSGYAVYEHINFFRETAALLLAGVYLNSEEAIFSGRSASYAIDWSQVSINILETERIIGSLNYADYAADIDFIRKTISQMQISARKDELDKIVSSVDVSQQTDCADSIKVRGLCWVMSVEEMVARKVSEGFVCEIDSAEGLSACEMGANRILFVTKPMIFFPEGVSFSCENFNVCGVSFREVANLLVKNNLVSEMQYERNNLYESYCGLGAAGDRLCVLGSNEVLAGYGMSRNIVVLSKGASGGGGISFD